jgi:NAD dependent epimerase/dehydratase family enzyme
LAKQVKSANQPRPSALGAIEWYDAVKGCTGIVNLAGAPISDPWNEDYKKVLVKSRLGGAVQVELVS